jgi:hypothetical protein
MARGAAGSGQIEQQQRSRKWQLKTKTKTKTKTKKEEELKEAKKTRRKKKEEEAEEEVEVERALETLRLPSGVSFDMLAPELKAELRRRVMKQCGGKKPVRCPRCGASEALVLRYFNNRRSPGQLQPRFRCSNPRSCSFLLFAPLSSTHLPLRRDLHPRIRGRRDRRRRSSSCSTIAAASAARAFVEFYFKPGPGPSPAGPILTRKTRDLFFSAAIASSPPSPSAAASASHSAAGAGTVADDDDDDSSARSALPPPPQSPSSSSFSSSSSYSSSSSAQSADSSLPFPPPGRYSSARPSPRPRLASTHVDDPLQPLASIDPRSTPPSPPDHASPPSHCPRPLVVVTRAAAARAARRPAPPSLHPAGKSLDHTTSSLALADFLLYS